MLVIISASSENSRSNIKPHLQNQRGEGGGKEQQFRKQPDQTLVTKLYTYALVSVNIVSLSELSLRKLPEDSSNTSVQQTRSAKYSIAWDKRSPDSAEVAELD